jgi:NRPS condensation-like uncharacterized protein
MTANELADCLEEILKGTAIGKDCANMLRQQEQTIEQYHNMLRDKDINIEYLREKLIASIDDIKTLKCQQISINFRQTHWEQLLFYIEDAEKIGCFYGNREQFFKRHCDIKNWVEEQLKKGVRNESVNR